MRLAPSLVNRSDPSHVAALRAGYSWCTLEWALKTTAEPWATRAYRKAVDDLDNVHARRAVSLVVGGESRGEILSLAGMRAEAVRVLLTGVRDDLGRGIGVAAGAGGHAPGVRGGDAHGGRDGSGARGRGAASSLGAPERVLRLDPAAQDRYDGAAVLDRINAVTVPLQGRPFAFKRGDGSPLEQLQKCLRRAACAFWWKRQLKRESARLYEARAVRAGRIGKGAGQVYCTDEAVARRALDVAAGAAMLESTEIEDADGNVITLKAAFDASPSSKPIRRGELMTRIRGSEEWAAHTGLVGLFTTNTAPSRFHSQAGRNPKYAGATAKESHAWLCKTWADTRAKLGRDGIKFFGFRVAEPHADSCAHWHMMLWMRAEDVKAFKSVMHRWWRRDDGKEAGSAKHRVKIKAMDPGGATGYCAKYISKGIDDVGAVGTEGHRDELADGSGAQEDVFGGNAKKVEAWASLHGIRQFQAFGQPPVTVWRELRRVSAAVVAGSSPAMQQAHAAVNRVGDQRADWCVFMQAQGGAMQGRKHRIRMASEVEAREGRYGTNYVPRPLGVADELRPGEICTSDRKTWKPRGGWVQGGQIAAKAGDWGVVANWLFARPKAAQPWTRVNNCTHLPGLEAAQALRQAGILESSNAGASMQHLRKPPDERENPVGHWRPH